MSSDLLKPMTLEEFLAWEERQELPYEFDGIRPVARAGGTADHAFIQVNLIAALGSRLRGGRCRVVGSRLKILVSASIRYPDAFVLCSTPPRGTQVVTDPVVVFEILSPSTSYTDRIVKNREYRLTPTIQRYVILEQTRQAVTVYARSGEDWVADVLIGDADLSMPEIGVVVPLAELYEGIAFPLDPDAGEGG